MKLIRKTLLAINTIALTTLLLSAAQKTVAQPKINTPAQPQENWTTQIYTLEINEPLSPGPAGIDFSWDFSAIEPVKSQKAVFKKSGNTPYSNFFGQNILAIEYEQGLQLSSGTIKYDFFDANSDGLFKIGAVSTAEPPVILKNTDKEQYMQFPYTYLSESVDSFKATYVANGYTVKEKGKTTTVADAYGSLILPNGFTVSDVLRVKINRNYKQDYYDTNNTYQGSNEIDDETYAWFSPKLSYPILRITTENNQFINVHYISSLPDEIAAANYSKPIPMYVQAFPNPTTQYLTVNYQLTQNKQQATLQLFDLHGKMLESANATNTHTFNVSKYAKGMYVLKMVVDNEVVNTQKIVIQ